MLARIHIHIVVFHTNGHSIWLAPWLAWLIVAIVVLWLIASLLVWVSNR